MLATDRWLMAAGMLAKGYSVNEPTRARSMRSRPC